MLIAHTAVADADPVVVRAGQSVLRVSDVERAMARVPAFQLLTLGDTAASIRRRFVDTVLVPELLFGEAANERRSKDPEWMHAGIVEARRRAMIERLRARLAKEQPIGEADISKFYQANLAQFRTPPRLRLFRILVAEQAAATRILSQSHGVGGFERWAAFARDHSLDTATRLRSGELGFVRPDGSTDVPQVRVDPALYEAAARVRDGELVGEPVREGERFAVVWRRGTIPESSTTLDEARDAIVQVLQRQQLHEALEDLVERLRREHLKIVDPGLIEQVLTVPNTGASASGSARPAEPAPSVSHVPVRTERGLR